MTDKTSSQMKSARMEEIAELAVSVFQRPPRRVAFPGGASRAAFVADMGDAPYIFAKREDDDDAQLEAIVLKSLGGSGRTPALVARKGLWVVQECLPGTRLPLVLDAEPDMAKRKAHVAAALDSLLDIHESARSTGLTHRVPKVGTEKNWLWNRTGAAKRIAKHMGLRVPDLDREWMHTRMDVKRADFVKWDARPGNAMVDEGHVSWFDWEDCGRSRALDDLGFVLFDEWTALDDAARNALERDYLSAFAGRLSADEAAEYLTIFGITHAMLRLRMALKHRMRDGKWWDRDYCLNGDKIGVTATESARLIGTINALSSRMPQFAVLPDWLAEVGEAVGLEDTGMAERAVA